MLIVYNILESNSFQPCSHVNLTAILTVHEGTVHKGFRGRAAEFYEGMNQQTSQVVDDTVGQAKSHFTALTNMVAGGSWNT